VASVYHTAQRPAIPKEKALFRSRKGALQLTASLYTGVREKGDFLDLNTFAWSQFNIKKAVLSETGGAGCMLGVR
jgi:hypothetical protein